MSLTRLMIYRLLCTRMMVLMLGRLRSVLVDQGTECWRQVYRVLRLRQKVRQTPSFHRLTLMVYPDTETAPTTLPTETSSLEAGGRDASTGRDIKHFPMGTSWMEAGGTDSATVSSSSSSPMAPDIKLSTREESDRGAGLRLILFLTTRNISSPGTEHMKIIGNISL